MDSLTNMLHWELNASTSVEHELLEGLDSKAKILKKKNITNKIGQEETKSHKSQHEKPKDISGSRESPKKSLFAEIKLPKRAATESEKPSKTIAVEQQIRQETEPKKRKILIGQGLFNQGIGLISEVKLPNISKTFKNQRELPSRGRNARIAKTDSLQTEFGVIDQANQRQTSIIRSPENYSTHIEPSMSMQYPILTSQERVDPLSQQFKLDPASRIINNSGFNHNTAGQIYYFSRRNRSINSNYSPNYPTFGDPILNFSQAMESSLSPSTNNHSFNKMRNLFEPPKEFVRNSSLKRHQSLFEDANSPKLKEAATPKYNFLSEKRPYYNNPMPLSENAQNLIYLHSRANLIFKTSALNQLGSMSPTPHRRNLSSYNLNF